MEKWQFEELTAWLAFITAAIIVGTQGWGLFSVLCVIHGVVSVIGTIYYLVEKYKKKENDNEPI